jgi:hypothetical protein
VLNFKTMPNHLWVGKPIVFFGGDLNPHMVDSPHIRMWIPERGPSQRGYICESTLCGPNNGKHGTTGHIEPTNPWLLQLVHVSFLFQVG